jgi:hypothetical protein
LGFWGGFEVPNRGSPKELSSFGLAFFYREAGLLCIFRNSSKADSGQLPELLPWKSNRYRKLPLPLLLITIDCHSEVAQEKKNKTETLSSHLSHRTPASHTHTPPPLSTGPSPPPSTAGATLPPPKLLPRIYATSPLLLVPPLAWRPCPASPPAASSKANELVAPLPPLDEHNCLLDWSYSLAASGWVGVQAVVL